MGTPHAITVTLADDGLADLDGLVERLRAAGMRVDDVLAPVGVVLGAADTECVTALSTMPGVLAVEDQQEMRTRSSSN